MCIQHAKLWGRGNAVHRLIKPLNNSAVSTYTCRVMYGWMDGCMDARMYGSMDGMYGYAHAHPPPPPAEGEEVHAGKLHHLPHRRPSSRRLQRSGPSWRRRDVPKVVGPPLAQERCGPEGMPVMGGALLPIQVAPLEGGGRGGEGAARRIRASLFGAGEGTRGSSLRRPPPLHLPASGPISRVQDADIPALRVQGADPLRTHTG